MQENKQESTRVCHALRHTFSKLSPAHDMKAIIDLACFPYNLDRAFSRTGYEKKKWKEKQFCVDFDYSSPEEFTYKTTEP